MGRRKKTAMAAAGLAVGLLLGFVLPSSWIFVKDAAIARAGHAPGDVQFACPMFCTIMDRLPEDGRCPVCGMDMTPVSGQNTLNAQERRMVGLEVDALRRTPLSRTVRVVGEVDYDETRVARITTRMPGWLERVWAGSTWMEVRKGQKLASIYSPELYAAQKEYLVAWDASSKRKGDATAMALLHAAERRLKLLGIGEDEIAGMRAKKAVQESLVLRAPRDGVIIERRALEGASVKTGDLLYTVADLSRVWVQAEVFESDLVWVFEQQAVRVRVEGGPMEILGRVAFIDPVVNRKTRTARVRIEVDNPAGPEGARLLRVGQRADVWIDARVNEAGRPVPPAREVVTPPLAVPRSAVLSTGQRRVVYLLFADSMGRRDYELDPAALPETVYYQLVPVRLGPLASRSGEGMGSELYPVLGLELSDAERGELQLDALKEGMVVVTRGNLLLDSQAQLSGKPSLLFPEGSRGSTDPHAGH
ncbi:MAG: efflux RND transporter periplasmic adaptor subunit [Planctomycetota bacterium]|jgi:Cu(I)/Ag(I) efflux system membrane fusion protein